MLQLVIVIACCGVILQSWTVCAFDAARIHHPVFTIDSPPDFSTLVIKPPEVKLNNLFIQFSTSDVPRDSEICVIISAFGTQSQNKPEQCVNSNNNHIALSGLNPGYYIFQFIVKKTNDPVEYYFDTLQVLRVAIKTVEESLPDLDFATPGELFFIKPEDTNSVDVMLDLVIAESILYDVLDLCVVVEEISAGTEGDEVHLPQVNTKRTISDVCTSLRGTPAEGSSLSFSLPDLATGHYEASLLLQGGATSPVQRFSASKRTKIFRVVTRADTLPVLVSPVENVEYVIEANQQKVEVKVPHRIAAKDAAILQADNVKVCLRLFTPMTGTDDGVETSDSLENVPDSFSNGNFNSCASVHSAALLSAGALGEGIHQYELALHEGERLLASEPKVTGVIDIRRPQEFVPSFEWQPLHAWHTAPKGIQIRLPVGGTGLKEARVPEPWRLQLSMPHPCKFFLRLDTFRHTTVKTIRDEAAMKCKVDSHCLMLEAPGEDMDYFADTDTVLSSRMFQKKLSLEFNASCVEEEDDDEEDLDLVYS